MHLLGISRDTRFSPNMSNSDGAIFLAVVEALRRMGCDVDCMTEAEFRQTFATNITTLQADAIFGMYRDDETLRIIRQANDRCHIPAITPCIGIHNAGRRAQMEVLSSAGIPIPRFEMLTTATDLPSFYPCWLKKGEGWSEQKEDVVYVADEKQAVEAMQMFSRRAGSADFVVMACEHLAGDLVKFYGVEGTGFFDWDYASKGHSKFGLESINGVEHRYDFSEEQLSSIANAASAALSSPIYGGDAVIASDGSIRLIDFNDWPSFSRCREKAAAAIAHRIINHFKQ